MDSRRQPDDCWLCCTNKQQQTTAFNICVLSFGLLFGITATAMLMWWSSSAALAALQGALCVDAGQISAVSPAVPALTT
jgi:hypothetical protein